MSDTVPHGCTNTVALRYRPICLETSHAMAEAITPYQQQLLERHHLRLQYSQAQGRYLVTTKALKAGDVALRSPPYITVAKHGYCDRCFAKKSDAGADLQSCSRCKRAMYCSPACQAAAWKSHHKRSLSVLGFPTSPRTSLHLLSLSLSL